MIAREAVLTIVPRSKPEAQDSRSHGSERREVDIPQTPLVAPSPNFHIPTDILFYGTSIQVSFLRRPCNSVLISPEGELL